MKSKLLDLGKNRENITEMYAFISDDGSGEGIIAMTMPSPLGGVVQMPFVGADMKRVESLRPLAKKLVKEHGKKVKLIKFTTREDLEEYT